MSNSPTLPSAPTPPSAEEKARLARARLVIFFTVFLDILGFGIIIPQLSVYAAQFGATPQVAGALAATYSAMGFLFSAFWGRLSDRIGRRPVLLYSIFGTTVAHVIFALASSLPWLFGARVMDGITGANISTAQAYIADITDEKDRARTFGLFGAIFGIGFALGPAIGWALSTLPGAWGGNLGLGAFSALLSLINWGLALLFLPETLSKKIQDENKSKDIDGKRVYFNWKGFGRALQIPNLNVAIMIGFLATAAFATMQGSYGLFVIKQYVRPQVQEQIASNPQAAVTRARALLQSENAAPKASGVGTSGDQTAPYPPTMGGDYALPNVAPPPDMSWRHVEKLLVRPEASAMVGIIFTIIGVLSLVVQGGMIRPLEKRFGQVNMVLAGTLIMAIALATIPLPPPGSFWGQYLAAALLTLGNGLFTPILTALVSQFSPENERGEIIGVYQSTQSLGRIIGPNLGGTLFGVLSPGAPFIAGGIIMFSSFVLAFKLRDAVTRHARGQEQAEPV